MTEPKFELVTTKGGAHAVLDLQTREVMHAVAGPAVEADQLYLTPSRLEARLQSDAAVTLLDVGLGAGANAVAAWSCSEYRSAGARLTIHSFDRTVEALSLARANASRFGWSEPASEAVRSLIETGVHQTDRTDWRLHLGELPETLAEAHSLAADVVFWDPFSPRANPDLWTVRAFSALRPHCRSGCTLHTYSAATSVRSAMLLAGFVVGFGPGSGRQSESTIAAVDLSSLQRPLDRRWLLRLTRSDRPWPHDAPEGALARIADSAQFSKEKPGS